MVKVYKWVLRIVMLLVILHHQAIAADTSATNDTSLAALPIERPVNSAFTFDIGGAHILDTYLTPIKYKYFTQKQRLFQCNSSNK